MSLLKASAKQAISKSSRAVHIGEALKAETSHVYSAANVIVLTVNPQLDKAASGEKLNGKAESAKQMFSKYRNKK